MFVDPGRKADALVVGPRVARGVDRHDATVALEVDEHSAEATYNNGVLEVTFDRAEDSADIDVS